MIRSERQNDVLCISLNRPERRNALSLALLDELQTALTDVGESTAVIITGEGSVFSAGADLLELTGTSEDVVVDDAIAAVVAAIQDAPVPVIAWIDGACVGGAVDLMLACDIRVASGRAWFQVPATRLGLLYNPVAVARMRTVLPRNALDRLLIHGDRFDSGQALAAGLATHAALPGKAAELATPPNKSGPPNVAAAAAATHALLDAIDDGRFIAEEWQQKRRELLDSPERAAAIAAATAGAKG